MIKTILALTAAFVITTSAFQCKKEPSNRISGCLKGKVIDALCASYIIQVTEGDYDPSLVVDSWVDPQTGNTYNKVFAVSNHCEMQGKIAPGQEFNFYFSNDTFNNDCATCMAIRETPSKMNTIKLTGCGN